MNEGYAYKQKSRNVAFLASVCVLIMGLAACTPSNQTKDESTDSKEPATQVQMPAPNENGIITAEAWKDIYL